MRVNSLLIAAIVVIAVPVTSAVGDDDNGDGAAANPAQTTTQTTSQSPSASRALAIRMTEYAFDPKDAVAKAGRSQSALRTRARPSTSWCC